MERYASTSKGQSVPQDSLFIETGERVAQASKDMGWIAARGGKDCTAAVCEVRPSFRRAAILR